MSKQQREKKREKKETKDTRARNAVHTHTKKTSRTLNTYKKKVRLEKPLVFLKSERKNAHKKRGVFSLKKVFPLLSSEEGLLRERDKRNNGDTNRYRAFLENSILMVESRPKRACADGIDYAGTDQVPGWTVREEGEFFFPSSRNSCR